MKAITIFTFLVMTMGLYAQRHTIKFDEIASKATKKSATKNNNPVFNFSYYGVNIIEVNTNNGLYNQLIIPNTYRSGSVGSPQLISSHKLIEIPANCSASINVIDYTVNEYNIDNYFADNKLIPYQPTYSKKKSSDKIKLVVDTNAYIKNEYKKTKIASIKILGTLRDKRIAKISINPIEYNPAKNSIRVYNNINVEVIYSYKKSSSKSTSTKGLNSPYFSKGITKVESALPATKYIDHPDLTTLPVKYLIVTPNNYLSELDEFIKWKTQKGFQVVVGALDEIGATATEIKTWVHNQYTNSTTEDPAPSFLLLVGDIEQVPASQLGENTKKATDLYYASVDGDMFPDMYYGRLPAQTSTQLAGIIAKTLMYEKYQFSDDSFLNNATLIAGSDSTWNPKVGQPTVNYGTDFYFNTTNGFTNVNSYLTSYTGCYDTDKVGVSMVSYTAHCTETSWLDPSLTTIKANNFTNSEKYPVAIGNCCRSGDFSINECIGESWIRNPNGGAIAYLGSVPDTFWWEDFYWSVGAHAPVSNTYPDVNASSLGVYDAPFSSEYKTVDAMVFVGNLAVTEAHNEGFISDINSLYYWEAYHCLGDPSIAPYLTQGIDNIAIHQPAFPYNTKTFQVEASPGSLVALSNNNGLIGTATTGIDNIATIPTDTLTLTDSIFIVVTKPQHKPYSTKIPIVQAEGPYLIVETTVINDILGNNNNAFEYNEISNIEITIKNIGDQTAEYAQVSLTTTDSFIEYLNNNHNITTKNIPSGGLLTITNAFNIKIKDSIADGHIIPFTLELSDSTPLKTRNKTSYTFSETVNAPEFQILNHQILDDFAGNGNSVIDYGETATLQLAVINSGHSLANSTVTLSNISFNKTLSPLPPTLKLDSIAIADTTLVNFEINLPTDAIVKHSDTLLLRIESGKYFNESIFIVNLGQTLSAEIGKDNIDSDSYPFNNYYLNNTTQILYLKSEIGEGSKVLKAISLDISKFTPDIDYRDFNNLKIEAIFTDLHELTSAIDFTNAQLLYSKKTDTLPNHIGWIQFELQHPLIISNNKNIIIQISWGTIDDYTTDSFTVNCTKTLFKSVAWGENDDTYPAPIDNAGFNRPNMKFNFDSVGIINIAVQGNIPVNKNPWIENCGVSINSTTNLTNTKGQTQFYFTDKIADYTIGFNAYEYSDMTIILNKKTTYSHVDITMLRNFADITILAQNTSSKPIKDAILLLSDISQTSEADGLTTFLDIIDNTYALRISHPNYKTIYDTINIGLNDTSLTYTLKTTSNITVNTTNGVNVLQGIDIKLNSTVQTTGISGNTIFNNIEEGSYLLTINNDSFHSYSNSINVHKDTIINIVLDSIKPIPDVEFTITNGLFAITDVKIELNNTTLLTDTFGKATFTDIPDGNYNYSIKKSGYKIKTGSITVAYSNIKLNIILETDNDLYNVKFIISDNNGPVYGVDINFANKTESTNSLGVVEFSSIKNTINLPYYVLEEDAHVLDSGMIDVHCDTTLNIMLTRVSINNTEHHINIYPNPTKGLFFIEYNEFFEGAKYIVFSNNGEIIEEGIITNRPQSIDLSSNQKGIYHLKLITKDKTTTHSIVLE